MDAAKAASIVVEEGPYGVYGAHRSYARMRAGTAAGLAQINLDDDGGSAQQDAEHCADGLRPAFVPRLPLPGTRVSLTRDLRGASLGRVCHRQR
jgi:hypothetical protein